MMQKQTIAQPPRKFFLHQKSIRFLRWPDRHWTEVAMETSKFRERARRSHTKPRKLYSDLVQSLPTEVTGFMPAHHNMAKIARRQRKLHLPTPKSREEIDLEAYFANGALRPEYVLFDSGREDRNRIIIFKAEDFQYLRQANNWIMDGTFQICPALFTQLYTIHVELFGAVFPVLFALLPDKSGPTYDRLFGKIREVLESVPFENSNDDVVSYKPLHIIVDYERAVINSITKIFPKTMIQGICYHKS